MNNNNYKYDLSICMIVKNEEKYIERCLMALEPLRKAVNCELIITDTGSTDNTVEIIKKYADKVLEFEWCNDFSKARNTGIEASNGAWLLYLDADEIFEDSILDIANFMNNVKNRDSYDAGTFVMNNYTHDTEDSHISSTYICHRLINMTKGKRFFKGAVHENIPVILNFSYNTKTVVKHYGYTIDVLDYKHERAEKLLIEEYENNPYDLRIASLLANQVKDSNKKIEILEKSIKLDKNLIENKASLNPIYVQLAKVYFFSGQGNKFEEIALEYIELDKNKTQPKLEMYYLCYWYYNNNKSYIFAADKEKAVSYMKKFIKLYEDLEKEPDYIYTALLHFNLSTEKQYYEINFNLSIYYQENNDNIRAVKYFGKNKVYRLLAGQGQKQSIEAQLNIITSYISMGAKLKDYKSLYKMYKWIDKSLPKEYLYNCQKMLNDLYNQILEENTEENQEHKELFLKEFSKEKDYDVFTTLNLIRLKNYNIKECDINLLEIIKKDATSYNAGTNAFADLFYVGIKSNIDVFEFSADYSVSAINSIVSKICENHEDFLEEFYEENVLKNNINNNINNINLSEIMFKAQVAYIYITENITSASLFETTTTNDYKYEKMFNYFIEITYNYLNKIYSKEVIENEYTSVLLPYQTFCFLVYKGLRNNDTLSKEEYFNIIQNALYQCPDFMDICRVMVNIYNPEKNKNLEELIVELKKSIQKFISSKDINNAAIFLQKYVKINPTDPDIIKLLEEIELLK